MEISVNRIELLKSLRFIGKVMDSKHRNIALRTAKFCYNDDTLSIAATNVKITVRRVMDAESYHGSTTIQDFYLHRPMLLEIVKHLSRMPLEKKQIIFSFKEDIVSVDFDAITFNRIIVREQYSTFLQKKHKILYTVNMYRKELLKIIKTFDVKQEYVRLKFDKANHSFLVST